jgi:hypothetical protein
LVVSQKSATFALANLKDKLYEPDNKNNVSEGGG